MRGMILAAGFGKRLQPLTLSTPKPLIPVMGKPLIVYHIERLVTAGITELVINHAWLGEQIEQVLGDGSCWGANIHYSAEGEPLETAGGIAKALPLLSPSGEPFVVINGDIYTDYSAQHLSLKADKLAHLILVDNPDFHPNGDFALHNHLVSNSGEHKLTFSGISVMRPQLFDGVQVGSKHPLKPLLDKAIAQQRVSGEHYTGLWSDIGTRERLETIEHRLRKTEK